MSTKTAKIRSVLMLTAVEKGEWAAHYAAKNSFPKKEVPCSSCNDGITMFGTNLRNRIERFESVDEFLEQFVCRTCKGKLKRGEAVDTKTAVHNHKEDVVNEVPEEEIVYDDSEECSAASEEEVAEEGSYVIEPGDDDDEIEEITAMDDEDVEEEVVQEETVAEDIVVFDDSDEDESDHQSVNAEALREKYKAFYAMKR